MNEIIPMESIPKRELLVWESEQVRQSLLHGITDVEEGRIRRLDNLLYELEEQ